MSGRQPVLRRGLRPRQPPSPMRSDEVEARRRRRTRPALALFDPEKGGKSTLIKKGKARVRNESLRPPSGEDGSPWAPEAAVR